MHFPIQIFRNLYASLKCSMRFSICSKILISLRDNVAIHCNKYLHFLWNACYKDPQNSNSVY